MQVVGLLLPTNVCAGKKLYWNNHFSFFHHIEEKERSGGTLTTEL